LVAERTWRRADFVERSDGSIRLAPGLVQELAATMPAWAHAVAPHAEAFAHLLGPAVRGKWEPRTPLSGAEAAAARRHAKVREGGAGRRVSCGGRPAAGGGSLPRRPFSAGCAAAGGPPPRPRHVRCEACWAKTPAQSREARRRRGRAIATAIAGLREWRAHHP